MAIEIFLFDFFIEESLWYEALYLTESYAHLDLQGKLCQVGKKRKCTGYCLCISWSAKVCLHLAWLGGTTFDPLPLADVQ